MRYKLSDGTVVPRATDVISHNLGWNKQALLGWQRKMFASGLSPDKVRDEASDVGTLAHALVQDKVKGWREAKPEAYPPAVQDAAEVAFHAFLQWEAAHSVEYRACEVSLVSEGLRYGGTIDAVALVDGELCLIDLKTSDSVWPEHVVQVAAYRHLWQENMGETPVPIILHLGKRNGEFTVHRPDVAAAWRVFLHLLALERLRVRLLADMRRSAA